MNIPKITNRTNIPQHHRPRSHVHAPIDFLNRRRLPHSGAPRHRPTRHPNHTDPQHATEILHPRLAPYIVLLHNLRQHIIFIRVHIRAAPGIAESPAQKRRRRVRGISNGGSTARHRPIGGASRITRLVVETLSDENPVRDTEVYGDSDNDGDETGPGTSDQIGDIADEPDEEKEQGDGFGVAVAVVFD